jgi:asparagine synthase (glutamine-hydrolysing)
MRHHLPSAIIDRPKMGFGAPILSWVNGPLEEPARDLVLEWWLREYN